MGFTKENAAYYGKMGGLKGGSKGGKNGSHEDKVRAGQLGFEATCISHPYFARHWLQYMPGMKRHQGGKSTVVHQEHTGKRRKMQ